MKIILLQDVAKIGKRSQIVEVPDGYALNQLIPKKMAEPATAANLKRVEKLQTDLAKAESADKDRYDAIASKLHGVTIAVPADVNEQGHLFKAVSPQDVVEAAKTQGHEIDEGLVSIQKPIKEAGAHIIQLIRGTDSTDVTIEVVKK